MQLIYNEIFDYVDYLIQEIELRKDFILKFFKDNPQLISHEISNLESVKNELKEEYLPAVKQLFTPKHNNIKKGRDKMLEELYFGFKLDNFITKSGINPIKIQKTEAWHPIYRKRKIFNILNDNNQEL